MNAQVKLDPKMLQTLKDQLQKTPAPRIFTPFHTNHQSGNREDQKKGQELINQGFMGCIILAGGQGTRLGFDGPKGAFPLGDTCLFEIFAKKTLPHLPVAIMTSPKNDAETRSFWKQHDFFGLKNVSFFVQSELPMLDEEGNFHGDFGPDGNGYVFRCFKDIWKTWHEAGVGAINIVLVDNALADPFDAELLGFQQRMQADVAVKCIKRKDEQEKVGVLVNENGRLAVVEYFELGDKKKGDYLANLSLFCVTMEFAKQAASIELPLHAAKKQGLWKFETFLFDLLPFAKKAEALIYPREACFAPLKNATGPNSPAEVLERIKR